MRVLVLNAGSSTLKAAVVDGGKRVADASADWPAGDADASGVVATVLDRLPPAADAVGYRVVHGGAEYRRATRADEPLLERVERLDQLAPLHNRRAAAVMRAGLATLSGVPHVACFDTAFHAPLPEAAWRYPIPSEWSDRFGIRRFGFHGLSVAWSVRRAAELLGRPAGELRLVVAHLGAGCSVTAVDGGRSVETSMGLTPYEGLMMATRSGSVDPGILLHLLRGGVSTDELADAGLALEMFARRAAASVAAASTALPLLDAVVFTGGIGEHSVGIRQDIIRRLATLGFAAPRAGLEPDGIEVAGPPAVLVISAREDLVVAEEVSALLG